MKGLFIPEITAEMFRNGCLESIEELMAEGEIYDIEYSKWIPCSERLPEEHICDDGYEEQQNRKDEIRVGDEVYVISENNKSVVTNIFNASHGPVAMLLSGDAKWIDVGLQYLNKTGKHYDAIEEVLKELRGDGE